MMAAVAFSQTAVSPDVLVGLRIARADAGAEVRQAQLSKTNWISCDHRDEFLQQLLRRDEQVRIVHREAAHARQARQFAALLVAVDRAEFRQPHGQIAVGAQFALVDHDVVRAVHRLEQELFAIHLNRAVLAVLVVRIVPGRAVQVQLADVRRHDRQIAAINLRLAQEAFQRLAQDRAFRLPQRQTLADQRIDHEQAELRAQDAVIARLGFFEQVQVFLQLLGGFPGRAVDARQHLRYARRRASRHPPEP